ncbi:hypothetical protein ACH4HG_19685 [Streptomyces coeruleorubidus]|uniref:Uncharacterized protein n=1 Tax=Streptomyces coeruleorubidus TaxID=116188 RepID=A0A5J6IHY4_STRC4|nr:MULTISPECIES: hypothetical protein [Streptomyces]QEV30420.1 hypothetical protein CP976_19985 [Streptomyces coeruleorubidus]WOT35587.1 hypothetical protein R5U08_16250 [Streptomyces coeruleorubidus]GGT76333.1 hypothetical protein GCM10010256_38990 [Streptomyces coeruleorubidus]GGU05361.1 hypothetical protein GCM10010244_34400 [Streptomyces bellus]
MNHAQLTALGRALRLLGEHGEALTSDTPDAKLHEVKADLKRALDLLEESVSNAAPSTRCPEHPNGPVDEAAPDLCLLCETRRRAARRAEFNGPAPHHRPTEPVQSRYGVSGDRPQPQQRWLPELWNGQTWQLCGTPRRDRREAELYIAAQRKAPRAAMAYRLVHEFTDYEVLRVWGTPVRVDIEPMGNL